MRLVLGSGLRKGILIIPFILALGSAGCGSSTGTISGKVYYKNSQLKGGNVTFLTTDKKVSMLAEIQEDGSYRIDKMPAGEVLISVETRSFRPPAGNRNMYAPPKGQEVPGGYKPPDFAARAKRFIPIPDQYADADKSGLKYTVKGGSQNFDIKLE